MVNCSSFGCLVVDVCLVSWLMLLNWFICVDDNVVVLVVQVMVMLLVVGLDSILVVSVMVCGKFLEFIVNVVVSVFRVLWVMGLVIWLWVVCRNVVVCLGLLSIQN